MPKPILEVSDLVKYFPVLRGIFRREKACVKAVDGISFDIKEGEIVGLVGESGSGKSTAARAAIRLIEPTSGKVAFNGRDLLACSSNELRSLRREMQMIFQDPYASLNPRKTVLDTIGEGMLFHGIAKNFTEMKEKVVEVLTQVGLPADILTRYSHQFSGGQQQRISIGRAIAILPKLLICDEAVASLDVSVQAQILNLLYQLKDQYKLSILFISHDLRIVRHFCDRVLILYLGKIVEQAPIEDLFNHPKHPYTKALLESIPATHPKDRKPIIALKGEIPSVTKAPTGCPFHPRCLFAQPICSTQTPPIKSNGHPGHTYSCIIE